MLNFKVSNDFWIKVVHFFILRQLTEKATNLTSIKNFHFSLLILYSAFSSHFSFLNFSLSTFIFPFSVPLSVLNFTRNSQLLSDVHFRSQLFT